LSFHFHGLAHQEIGFVAPLLDGVHGGFGEEIGARDGLHIGDVAVFIDVGFEHDRALELHRHGALRVGDRNAVH
jgi:hypothetical protein